MKKKKSNTPFNQFKEPLRASIVAEGEPLTPEQKKQEQAFLEGFDKWAEKQNSDKN